MAATEKLPRLGALGHKIADSFVGLPALVTGGTSGIGAAIATALQEAGTTVWRQGLSDGDLQFDLSIPGSGAALAEAALQRGPIDIIVLSASIQSRSAWQAVEPAAMELQLRTNLIEPFDLVRRLLPAMIQREWGRVLASGSVQQLRPNPAMLPYVASKSAQQSIVRTLAPQVASSGATINGLSPGIIITPRNTDVLADDTYRRSLIDAIPAGRLGTPADGVPPAITLCSRGGGYTTGQNIIVDGGYTLYARLPIWFHNPQREQRLNPPSCCNPRSLNPEICGAGSVSGSWCVYLPDSLICRDIVSPI